MATERLQIMLIKTGLVYQDIKPYEFNNELSLIKNVVNGRLQLGDIDGNNKNFLGAMRQVSFVLAATDVEVEHSLGVVPVGYLVIQNGNGGGIYNGNGTWNKTNIYLRSTTATNNVVLFILG